MHTLHTTQAFVLQKYPQGESNYTYKLLTRTFGLLYAHGQGVRELKSRNKYALRTGQFLEVTLVKGREVWRITGAQNPHHVSKAPVVYKRRILDLVGKLIPVEDVSDKVFETLLVCYAMNDEKNTELARLVELVTMLRLMDALGFVARPLRESYIEQFLEIRPLTSELIEQAKKHEKKLVLRVNSALEEAK